MNFIFYWTVNIWVAASCLGRAHNFKESVEYIYIITSTIVFTTSFTIIRMKQTQFFEMIEICEGILQKSELKSIKIFIEI